MDEACFSLVSKQDAGTLELKLVGELDRGKTARVERALESVQKPPLEHVVIDLSGLTFLDVAGLRTILSAHRRVQAEDIGVTVIRPRGLANRVFTLTRAGEILSMTDR